MSTNDNHSQATRKAVRRALSEIAYQPLPLFLLAAVLGIVADKLFSVAFAVWCFGFILTFLGWCVAFRQNRSRTGSLLLVAACFFLFGFWHHDRWNRFPENDLGFFALEIGQPAALQGTVVEMPKYLEAPPSDPGKIFESSDRTLFTLRAEKLRDGVDWISVAGRVSVVVDGDVRNLRIGDSLQLFGQLSRPVGPQNPGDYDYAAFLRGKRILCVFRCSSPDAVSVQKTGRPGMARFLEGVRRLGRERFERNMSPETAPLAAAMLLGIREGVDEETTQNLMETGTMHILAISGLHIGLVAATIGVLLAFFGVSNRTTAVVLVVTVLVYLFLTDVRPPAIRATALVCTVSAALYSGRRSLGVNALCATALVVLALNPTELFQFGAQLSFFATGAFFWVPSLGSLKGFLYGETGKKGGEHLEVERYEIRRWFVVEFLRRAFLGIVELVLISLTIWCVTMPLILDRIHLFTPIAVAVNPLLWFPLTAALLTGFATMIFGGIPGLGVLFGVLAHYSFQGLFEMIGFFQRLGGHYWSPGPPEWWIVGFYSVFAFFTFLPIPRPSAKILAPLLIFWLIVGYGTGYIRDYVRLRADRLTVTVFSVGHGNCVLIVTPQGKTIVYDVGCISSPKRGADVLSRGLWRLGRTKVDVVILSHPDNDHFNGVAHLANRFAIGTVLVSPYMFQPLERLHRELESRNISIEQLGPEEFKEEKSLILLREKLRERGIPLYEIGDGDTLDDRVLPNSLILHPPKTDFGESDVTNATSLVLRFEHRGVGVLLSGDLDGRLRSPFLERQPIRTDIVMVPHHGGRSNQTEALLEWTGPKLLLISAGRFTHRDAVLDGFRERGFEVRSTFEEGMIEIHIDKKMSAQGQKP